MHNYFMDEWRGLLALEALRDHGTVTLAAEVLRLSPSAVSQQLKRLEHGTGRTLTVQTGRTLTLTPAAYALLEAALPHARALSEQLRPPSTSGTSPTGHVRVAAFTTALRAGVLAGVADLRRAHPGLMCTLVEADPDRAHEYLVRGTVDVAVVHHWHGQPRPVHPELTHTPVAADVADIVCRDDDPLMTSAPFEELASRDWISTGPGTICHDWLCHLFAHAGHRPTIATHLTDFAQHVDAVTAGLGIALVPRLGRPDLPDGVAAIPHPSAPKRMLATATRTNQATDPAIATVRDHLGEILASGTHDRPDN
ncbi:LysR family transcriptional regulator [Amycolatopsis taiwanensis]|uniref:LysR family transcriptional regulator n=2 Tax=Amycolatopsis taiwanensis TaxID=342230 RepID=A0A9W6R490_9PSEU|nr:LysR family transcriptional regulator [Amycolatopsis taiwanensis]